MDKTIRKINASLQSLSGGNSSADPLVIAFDSLKTQFSDALEKARASQRENLLREAKSTH